MTTTDQQTHRFSRAEYEQMAALGFFINKRVELLAGEILDMPPQNNPHAVTIMLLNSFVTRHLDTDRYLIRPQLPLAVSDDDLPEPDLAIAEGNVRELKDHPTTALLVVEVSDDSLRRDRRKAATYANAGVKEYWIVNLRTRQIEQHTAPEKNAENTEEGGEARYATVRTLSAEDKIECTVLSLPVRQVKDFLPMY